MEEKINELMSLLHELYEDAFAKISMCDRRIYSALSKNDMRAWVNREGRILLVTSYRHGALCFHSPLIEGNKWIAL